MASQAEVDLVISTAGALPDLTRDLDRIIRTAEDGADEIDVQASLAVQHSLNVMSTQLDQVLNNIDRADPTIDVEAALDTRESIRNLRADVEQLTRLGQSGLFDPIELQAELDLAGSLRDVTRAVNDLVEDAERGAPSIEVKAEIDRDTERTFTQTLTRISSSAGTALLGVTRSVSQLGLAVGAAAPTVATLVTALQQIAPAAAVGTQAMLAQKLVAGTLKLALIGVQDAIENAFDPDIDAEELQKSLEALAPEARKFVVALREQRAELKAIQQGVQNRVFRDFDEIFSNLGTSVLPLATGALNRTADSLNRMAKNTATAAQQLADQGVLGQALKGATQGLENLEKVPARVARSFGFLSAAAAPAFNRITLAIDELSLKVATKLQRAFESGELEKAIDTSISLISQLGTVLGNFLAGVGNIFGGLTQSGRGLFDILEDMSEAFERLTGSKEFQSILNELALTADVLLAALLPLIEEAFKQLGPVIEILAPVVRDFIQAIGPELIPLVQQLGPILVDIALIMKEQLPFAIALTRGAIQTLSLALTAIKFILEEAVLPAARAVANFFKGDLPNSINILKSNFDIGFGSIKRIFTDFEGSTTGLVALIKDGLRNLGSAFAVTLVNAVSGALERIQGFFEDLGGSILNSIEGLVGRMRQLGFDIINGLADGLRGAAGSVLSVVQNIANSIPNSVKSLLDIRSPSRVMADIGKDTVKGFVNGMASQIPQLGTVANAIARQVQVSFANPVTGGPSRQAGAPIARIPAVFPQARERVTNIYIGGQLIEQILDDRIRAKMNQDLRVRSQGVRI